jgi:hypothetical protein
MWRLNSLAGGAGSTIASCLASKLSPNSSSQPGNQTKQRDVQEVLRADPPLLENLERPE